MRKLDRSKKQVEEFMRNQNHELMLKQELRKLREDDINKNNNDPDSTFKEALEPWSDLPKEEFLKEKTGMIMPGMVTNQLISVDIFNEVLRINQVFT